MAISLDELFNALSETLLVGVMAILKDKKFTTELVPTTMNKK